MCAIHISKKILLVAVLTTMLAAPALAQSYSATYGTGNIINLALAARGCDAAGIGAGAYDTSCIRAQRDLSIWSQQQEFLSPSDLQPPTRRQEGACCA
jgi:hypothetical protein